MVPCSEGEFRFQNQRNFENNTVTGRPELCVNGTFMALCIDGFGPNEATLFCDNNGYSREFYSM